MKRITTILLTGIVLMTMLSLAFKAASAEPASQAEAAAVVIAENDVRLFPNPVDNELNVLCEKFEIERLIVFGNSGEMVFTSPMAIPQGARITINMGSNAKGYYTVKVWPKDVKQPLTYRVYKM